MRTATLANEVQYVTWRIATLSRFLLYIGDKSIHLFATLKKLTSFQWVWGFEKVFQELKNFLTAPLILIRPKYKHICFFTY